MPLWTIILGCCVFVPLGLLALSYCYGNNRSEQFDRKAWRELRLLKSKIKNRKSKML